MSILNNIGGVVLKPIIKEMSRARLPKLDGSIFVKNIVDEIEVIRDEFGVAHIYAQNINDVIFGQGFVHAQDRLWQMEVNRRAARGRLSEFLGKDALDTDKAARTLGFERIAKQDWDLFGEEEHQLIISYCNRIQINKTHTRTLGTNGCGFF